MSTTSANAVRWVTVDTVDEPHVPDRRLAAFAIDTPQAGDHLPGAGVEINGWVIGRNEPPLGVRAVINGDPGALWPLSVGRPDVAADYPEFAQATKSGFSFWAPLDDGDGWDLRLDAVMADDATVPLATMHGTISRIMRQPTDGNRMVRGPDFVIIGAQRGGTTSMHAYLNAHPQVTTPVTKELHYLTDRHHRGRDWYLGQFPTEAPVGNITGEATPYALFHPNAPERLRAAAPEAKLIVLLRDPVERAYSHYRLERSRGEESLSFEDAIAAECERLAGEEGRLLAHPTYVSHAHNHASYLARGAYAPQLSRWFESFPKTRFLILRSEDFYARTARSFARVTEFLGIAPGGDIPFEAHNRTTGPPLDAAVRDRLARHFAPLNEELAQLLGWDPGWQ